MNKRPISYLQTDPKWAKKPYRLPGEDSTIYDSGCGPTCAAMLIETLTGKMFTPEDACNWSVQHGYKALRQGTYYSYFAPQFAAFGIKCWQLSWTNAYHNPGAKVHDQALEYLKQGSWRMADRRALYFCAKPQGNRVGDPGAGASGKLFPCLCKAGKPLHSAQGTAGRVRPAAADRSPF